MCGMFMRKGEVLGHHLPYMVQFAASYFVSVPHPRSIAQVIAESAIPDILAESYSSLPPSFSSLVL